MQTTGTFADGHVLAKAVRCHADLLMSESIRQWDLLESHPELQRLVRDGIDLIRVLAHVLEGKTLPSAFGAPGDWGYDTPIGKALFAELRTGVRMATPPPPVTFGVKQTIINELIDLWDLQVASDRDPANAQRRETLRECIDMLRMLSDSPGAGR